MTTRKKTVPRAQNTWHNDIPNDRMAHLVRNARHLLSKSLQSRLAEHDVSFGHWTFLRILWVTEGLTQKELSDQAGVMEPTTFTALKAMGSKRMIERRRMNDNQRKMHIYLTAKGRKLKDKLTPLAEEINRIALANVSSNDISATRRTLLAIVNNLIIDNTVAEKSRTASGKKKSGSKILSGKKGESIKRVSVD